MDILLIAGLWLEGAIWQPVLDPLQARGHRVTAITLPGQGAPPSAATLEDQHRAVLRALDDLPRPAMVVGHSAASALAWMACDARPQQVARVVTIGGFPSRDGTRYVTDFEVRDGVIPFPGWAAFEGPDSADLDPAQRAGIAAGAVPVPEGVACGVVRLHDERRYRVPVTVVCPEFSAAQARDWIEQGAIPELRRCHEVDCVDIDSGHWPMVSRPAELAALLATLADAGS